MTDRSELYPSATLEQLAARTAEHIRKASLPDPGRLSLANEMALHLERIYSSQSEVKLPFPRVVRGMKHIPTVLAQPADSTVADLRHAAQAAIAHVNWSEFYGEDSWSHPFLADFANGEGVGLMGYW